MDQQWGLLAGPFTPATLMLLAKTAEALRSDEERCREAVYAQISRAPQAGPEQILQLAVAAEAGMPVCVPARLRDKRRKPPKQNRDDAFLLPDHVRGDLHPFAAHARQCATWMEENRVGTLSAVGPFGPLPFEQGDAVEIANGAIVFSTNPAVPSEGRQIRRRTRVSVHRVSCGYVDFRGHPRVVAPEVIWAGGRGYWRWTAAANARVLSRR